MDFDLNISLVLWFDPIVFPRSLLLLSTSCASSLAAYITSMEFFFTMSAMDLTKPRSKTFLPPTRKSSKRQADLSGCDEQPISFMFFCLVRLFRISRPTWLPHGNTITLGIVEPPDKHDDFLDLALAQSRVDRKVQPLRLKFVTPRVATRPVLAENLVAMERMKPQSRIDKLG